MIEDAWWVASPTGHRENDNKEKAEWLKIDEPGINKIAMGPDLPLDMWVCDWCNADIVVETNGVEQFVPMFLSNALCQDCMVKEIKKHPEQEAAWLLERPMWEFWSPKVCGCPGCKARMEEIRIEIAEKMGVTDGEDGKTD